MLPDEAAIRRSLNHDSRKYAIAGVMRADEVREKNC